MKQLFILTLFVIFVSCYHSWREGFKPFEEQPAQELFVGEWQLTENSYLELEKRFNVELDRNLKLYLDKNGAFVLENMPAVNWISDISVPENLYNITGTFKVEENQYWGIELKVKKCKEVRRGKAVSLVALKNEKNEIVLTTFFGLDEIHIYFEKVNE